MTDEPREALERTERKLAKEQARSKVVDRIAASIEALREENNFAWRLAALYRGEHT